MSSDFLSKEFDELIRVWEIETNTKSICEFSQAELDNFYLLQKIIHEQESEDMPFDAPPFISELIAEVKSTATFIIDYLIKDFLDVRQEKIIKSCRKLQKIEDYYLTEAEKEFYRNLMSAFKGYEKTTNVSNIIADVCRVNTPNFDDSEGLTCDDTEVSSYISEGKVEYTLVRTISEIPPLVGQDQLNYGPFSAEEIVNMPKLNARILEKEKLVKIIKN